MMFPVAHGIFGAAQQTGPAVDKAALLAALADAAALTEADYTPESWAVLAAAVAAGQAVADDPGATQQQVDDATQAILAAIDGLVPATGVCTATLTHDVLAFDPSYSPADINGQIFSIAAPQPGAIYAVSTSLNDLKSLPHNGILWVGTEHLSSGVGGSLIAGQLADPVTGKVVGISLLFGEWEIIAHEAGQVVGAAKSPRGNLDKQVLGIGSDGSIYSIDENGNIVSAANMEPTDWAPPLPANHLAGSTSLAFIGLLQGSGVQPGDVISGRFITADDEFPAGWDWCGNALPEPEPPALVFEVDDEYTSLESYTVNDGQEPWVGPAPLAPLPATIPAPPAQMNAGELVQYVESVLSQVEDRMPDGQPISWQDGDSLTEFSYRASALFYAFHTATEEYAEYDTIQEAIAAASPGDYIGFYARYCRVVHHHTLLPGVAMNQQIVEHPETGPMIGFSFPVVDILVSS